jgi:hypothetical protein
VTFDEVPEQDEILSRFIFSDRHFRRGRGEVKPDAFLPLPELLETSIYRAAGLDRSEIQAAGGIAGASRAGSLKAWADVLAGVVLEVGLSVRPDNQPERHAAIIGWPDKKDEQIVLAQQLAAAATLQRLS